MAQTMIQVKDLKKSYGPYRAVKGITFDVSSGEVLGFLGPNGAGKTTTMKILTCFMAPTSGTATVAGKDVFEDSLEVRQAVGYLPEDTPIYQDMTTLEFLEFACALRQVPAERKTRRIQEIGEVCGLFSVMGKMVGELSKGFRQRVGLAQAMIHDPEILILDEPTSGLDPNQIVEIRELIKKIGKQKTVILSTHILPEVQATCNRVIIINEGKLVADGTTDELTQNGEKESSFDILVQKNISDTEAAADSGEPYRVDSRAFSKQVLEKLDSIEGVTRVTTTDGEEDAVGFKVFASGTKDLRAEIFNCVKDNDWILLEMQRKTMSLEDVFRKLTKEG